MPLYTVDRLLSGVVKTYPSTTSATGIPACFIDGLRRSEWVQLDVRIPSGRNQQLYLSNEVVILMNKDFIFSVFIAATLAMSPLSASETSQTQAPVDKVEAKELPPYLMNRGAVFAEDELIAAALGESFSAMITAVQSGEITDRHISTEDQQRHSFFMGALRRLATDPDPSSALPLVLKSF